MGYLVAEGGTFEATYESGVSGQVGTVAVRIDDNEGATVFGPTVLSISELGTTGVYVRTMTGPGVAGGQYSVLWSLDGTFDPETVSTEDLYVLAADGYEPIPPLVPIDSDGFTAGPARAWTTVEDVAECATEVGSDTSVLEQSVIAASQVLYALSARRFSGTVTRRVRPCRPGRCSGPWSTWVATTGVWAGSLDYGVYGTWPHDPRTCGCGTLHRVPLAGTAREVLEVTIDGQVLDASEYRLDEHRWLTRLPDADGNQQTWPGCQNLTLDETEEGTFSVLYTYGIDPPAAGVMAATELACAIYRSRPGADTAECPLPNGVVRIQRQGITIDLNPFAQWAQQDGAWRTGLPLVDMFLNAYNPQGRQRAKTVVWSPDTPRFPRPLPGAGS